MAVTFTEKKRRPRAALALFLVALMSIPMPASAENRDRDRDEANNKTATPIKHVIVIIGENRTFDNIFATYVPKHGTVSNLLSRGIIHSDGSPGPNADLAQQFQLQTINPPSYFIDTRQLINPGKTAYAPFLPTPEAGNAPPLAVTRSQFLKDPVDAAPPFDAATFSTSQLHTISPALEIEDLPADHYRRHRTEELHSRSDSAAFAVPGARYTHHEFQQAAKHFIPDYWRQSAV